MLRVAYVDVVRPEVLPEGACVFDVEDLPHLAFDHDRITAFAVEVTRARYHELPDPSLLSEEPFTLSRLRAIHEAVLATELQPDTFRRAMLPYLLATGEVERGGRGRPAELYQRR